MPNRAIIAAAVLAGICVAQMRATRRTPGGSIELGQVKKDRDRELKEQRAATAKKIALAREKLAQKKWAEARRILDIAKTYATDQSQASNIRSLYQQIEREGERQLGQAREAYQKREYLQAIESFERIRKIFGWLPAGLAAKQAIKQAEKDPSAQAVIQEAKAAPLNKLVERILTTHSRRTSGAVRASTHPSTAPSRLERIKVLPPSRQSRLVDLLERISKTYPMCPTGKRAAEELQQLYADEVFAEKLEAFREARKARAALSKAEMYRNAGMLDKAIECYQQVIREFPDTEQAAAAKLELSLLSPHAR